MHIKAASVFGYLGGTEIVLFYSEVCSLFQISTLFQEIYVGANVSELLSYQTIQQNKTINTVP